MLTQSVASKPIDEPEEKAVVRLAITYGVLRRLGFSETRVEECLCAIGGVGMDEAFEWVCHALPSKNESPTCHPAASPLRRGGAGSSTGESRVAQDSYDSQNTSYYSVLSPPIGHMFPVLQVGTLWSQYPIHSRCRCSSLRTRAQASRCHASTYAHTLRNNR